MKNQKMQVKSKVWIEAGGEVVAGDGKINLLERIEEAGSIQKAAGEIGMSYRHAWGFLQKMEKRGGIKLVVTQIGGREGGGAKLTPQGKEFLRRYSAFREGLDEYIEKKFRQAFR
ncbi:MAG: winged helix-turn-helix domain-containing protein [Deltaproteobacteria bacterium]|nr:winged helix-turn-helix domain-containing protein [Deltaproteobacteria bacterium]